MIVEGPGVPLLTQEELRERLASVDPLPSGNWSSRAAAGDALQRVKHDSPFFSIWIEDGEIKWSKAHTDGQSLSVFAVVLLEMAQACYRKGR